MTTNSIPANCSFLLDQNLKQTQTSQTNDPFLTGKSSSFHGNKDRTREGKNNRQRGIEWPKMSQVKWKVKWEIIVSVVLFLCTRRKQMEARQDAGWPKLGVGVACVTTRFKKEYQLWREPVYAQLSLQSLSLEIKHIDTQSDQQSLLLNF